MTSSGEKATPTRSRQLSLIDILLPLILIAGLVCGVLAGSRYGGWLGAVIGSVGGLLLAVVGFLLFMASVGLLAFLFGEDAIFLPEARPGEAIPELSRSFRRNRAIARAGFAVGVMVILGGVIVWIWRKS